ncbi:RidA family protein [Cobetia sp. 29-18-1]|uniref:RidA family protein n=1 Tax=Cobetia sp. 29-18-1 TaxID=3040018 RepID=UPI00244B501E|nr:RidA family protein [Cobetia sp. 29-18-1]MDH2299336.1 RidA family protein [Cobetia sp. 29-18-1]
MVHPVKTDLFASRAPLSWASVGNGILFTAQIPIDAAGNVVEGGIAAQTRQTLDNLIHTLECAGGDASSLTQVLIYVTDREHLATVNSLYAEYVREPYPNRAAIIVSGFAREEMLVEIVAYAALEVDV